MRLYYHLHNLFNGKNDEQMHIIYRFLKEINKK